MPQTETPPDPFAEQDVKDALTRLEQAIVHLEGKQWDTAICHIQYAIDFIVQGRRLGTARG